MKDENRDAEEGVAGRGRSAEHVQDAVPESLEPPGQRERETRPFARVNLGNAAAGAAGTRRGH